MSMKTSLLIAAALISAAPSRASAARSGCVAILPLTATSGAPAASRWDQASESSLARKGCVVELDWDSLRKILGDEADLGRDLRDPAILRRIGLLVTADQVVSRFYVPGRQGAVEEAMLVDVETGSIKRGRIKLGPTSSKRTSRDMRFSFFGTVMDADARPNRSGKKAAALRAAFGIEPKDALAMRDAVSDDSCESAPLRVDRIEKSVIDLKAHSWALKLKEGSYSDEAYVAAVGLSDHLKQDFSARLDQWSDIKRIPPLTRAQARKLEDAENRVIELIRRCDLPR